MRDATVVMFEGVVEWCIIVMVVVRRVGVLEDVLEWVCCIRCESGCVGRSIRVGVLAEVSEWVCYTRCESGSIVRDVKVDVLKGVLEWVFWQRCERGSVMWVAPRCLP